MCGLSFSGQYLFLYSPYPALQTKRANKGYPHRKRSGAVIRKMTRLIFNGRIFLGRDSFCEALIIKNGRIVKTGTSRELKSEAGRAEKTDAEGALVLPAFNDSHLHLLWTGKRAMGIDAAGAKSE